MELIHGKSTVTGRKILIVKMSEREALLTIEGLANQIAERNQNAGRFERVCDDGTDFSIAVCPGPNPETLRQRLRMAELLAERASYRVKSPNGSGAKYAWIVCQDCGRKAREEKGPRAVNHRAFCPVWTWELTRDGGKGSGEQ